MEEFLEKHGYPQEKFMKDRIIHAVTRFQAIWRGYFPKKTYPWALAKKRIAESVRPRPHNNFTRINSLTSEAPLGIKKGYHFEFIFDIGTSKEAVYSGVVTNLGGLGDYDDVVSVRFHDDDEVRHYQNRRFFYLENQCIDFKKRKGIEGRIIGKLKTVHTSRYLRNSGQVNTEDWRYHYPDGNPVE
jgi:hypothetical protein